MQNNWPGIGAVDTELQLLKPQTTIWEIGVLFDGQRDFQPRFLSNIFSQSLHMQYATRFLLSYIYIYILIHGPIFLFHCWYI